MHFNILFDRIIKVKPWQVFGGEDQMANIKSAKKRIKTIAKKKELNNTFRTSMRTAIKKVEKAVIAKDKNVKNLLNDAIKKLDKAAAKGLVHQNFANRNKARLTKQVNEMK